MLDHQPIPFKQLAQRTYCQNTGKDSVPGKALQVYSIVSWQSVENGPWFPALRSTIGPPTWIDRVRTAHWLIGVDRSEEVRLGNTTDNGIDLGNRTFPVFDFDISKLEDPTYVKPLSEVKAEDVLVYPQRELAWNAHTWVADPHTQELIQNFHTAYRQDSERLKRYIRLRRAPFEERTLPGYGQYTYQGVIDAIRKPKESNYQPFQEEDINWLNTYIKHLNSHS